MVHKPEMLGKKNYGKALPNKPRFSNPFLKAAREEALQFQIDETSVVAESNSMTRLQLKEHFNTTVSA